MSYVSFPYSIVPPLVASDGGTGSSTTLNNNRVLVSSSGKIVEASAILASKALVSDSNGLPSASTITSAQLISVAYWMKYRVAYTDLAIAGLTNDIELFSLPTKGVIHKVIVKNTTAFSGTTTYTLSVGINGNLVKYISVVDVTAAVSNTSFSVGATTINVQPENFGAATSIRISAVSTIDNLDQATQGAADIWVLTSLLP